MRRRMAATMVRSPASAASIYYPRMSESAHPVFRPATTADVPAIAALLDQPHGMVLLAERDGVLLASCHIERHGDSGYFGMFAVDPAQQGGGLGKAVLAEAERIARESWQCRAMHMTVIVQRVELIAWYERRGYRRTGEYQPFPYGDERFGIPRRDDLRFEVLRKEFAGVPA